MKSQHFLASLGIYLSSYFMIVFLMQQPNGTIWLAGFASGFILIRSFLEYTALKKDFPFRFKIRSQRKEIPKIDFFLVSFFTAFLLLDESPQTDSSYASLIIFWSILLYDFLIWLVYKKKKPFTIFVDENQLITTTSLKQERDIHKLNEIKFDRITKSFILYFKGQYQLSIKTKNYKKQDIDHLLELLMKTSHYELSIPQNYLDE